MRLVVDAGRQPLAVVLHFFKYDESALLKEHSVQGPWLRTTGAILLIVSPACLTIRRSASFVGRFRVRRPIRRNLGLMPHRLREEDVLVVPVKARQGRVCA